MMRKRASLFALFCALAALVLISGGKSVSAQKPGKSKRPPQPVETALVIEKEISESLSLFGNVRAENSATVRAELQGSVIFFGKDVGDKVAKGEIICKIDPSKYEIDMASAKAELKRSEAGLEKAQMDEKRLKTLYEKNVASLEQTQVKTLNRKMAEAETASRRSALDQAIRSLKLASVRTPYGGHLAVKYIHTGDWVRPGDPVFDIVDLSSVYVYVDLPERYLGGFKLQSPARIWLDAYPNVEFKGTVTRISPRASQKTRDFTIRVEFDAPNRLARDGLFARVDITTSRHDAIMVPKDAVVERGPLKILFTVKNGKAKQVSVDVISQTGSMVEVRGDLKAGEVLVVTGNEILRDGAEVNVTLTR